MRVTTLKRGNANAKDALRAILRITRQSSKSPFIQEIAQDLNTGEQFHENLYNFAYKSIYFEPNPDKHQRIKTPEALIRDGKGSCVDYSILIGAVLLAAGEPVNLKLVSIDGEGFGHIYPVTADGTILDCVYGQQESGNEFRERPLDSTGKFNQECTHQKAIDNFLYPDNMRLSVINGSSNTINYATNTINGCPCQSINGMWVPMEINGVNIEPKTDDVSDADYQEYILAVMLEDPDALSMNGLKDWNRKRKEKKAQRKQSKAENKERRQANRAKRREKFGNLVDVGIDFLKSKGQSLDAESKSLLADLDEAGINPSDDALADLLTTREATGDGGGGEKDNTMLYVGAAALAALFLLKK